MTSKKNGKQEKFFPFFLLVKKGKQEIPVFPFLLVKKGKQKIPVFPFLLEKIFSTFFTSVFTVKKIFFCQFHEVRKSYKK